MVPITEALLPLWTAMEMFCRRKKNERLSPEASVTRLPSSLRKDDAPEPNTPEVSTATGCMIDFVTFKQWTAVDRSTLETVSQYSDNFIDTFCEKLEALRSHSFIASQQSKFFSESKSSLKRNEIIVCADFSENFICLCFTRCSTGVPMEQFSSNYSPLCHILQGFWLLCNTTPQLCDYGIVWVMTQLLCTFSKRNLLLSSEMHFLLRLCTSQMALPRNIKTGNTSPTCAITKLILMLWLNGTSLQYLMERVHAMALEALWRALQPKPAYRGHMRIKLWHLFNYFSGQCPTYLVYPLITVLQKSMTTNNNTLKHGLTTAKQFQVLLDCTFSFHSLKTLC